MYARKQIDIGYRDLTAALGYCLWHGTDRRRLETNLEALWGDDAVTALSVRTAFDCWLATQHFPRGSEVIVSGINIPDMARILKHHDLKIVPIDLDLETLQVNPEELRRAITPKTRLVLIAHLFGARMDMAPVFQVTDSHPDILVVEDCAQAFTGTDEYLGHERSDISLFSFGAIKTATALGGAMCRIRDKRLRQAVAARLAEYPAHSRLRFFRRVLKYVFLKTLGQRFIYGAFVRACAWMRVDFDQLTVSVVRGFKGEDLIAMLRHQPALPQLALVLHGLPRLLVQRELYRAEHRYRLGGSR